MPARAVSGGRRFTELAVDLERLVHGNRVGLRVDDDSLVIGDRATDIREGALDRGECARVGADGIWDSLALDQPHIAAGGGDDQAVGFDESDRKQLSERAGHASVRWVWVSASGEASRTSPCLSGRVGGLSSLVWRRKRYSATR